MLALQNVFKLLESFFPHYTEFLFFNQDFLSKKNARKGISWMTSNDLMLTFSHCVVEQVYKLRNKFITLHF